MAEDTALKIACGLGSGMARAQQVCGAVTGGILVLGLRHGRGSREDRSATELTYQKTRQLMAEFTEQHGTCVCRELLNGCDLTTEQGQKQFKENELLKKVCLPSAHFHPNRGNFGEKYVVRLRTPFAPSAPMAQESRSWRAGGELSSTLCSRRVLAIS